MYDPTRGKDYVEERTALMRRCPQQFTCTADACPLDPGYHRSHFESPDVEQCTARKSTRQAIVAQARAQGLPVVEDLLFGGLTRKEHGDQQRSAKATAAWEALSEAEQQERIANLKPFSRQ